MVFKCLPVSPTPPAAVTPAAPTPPAGSQARRRAEDGTVTGLRWNYGEQRAIRTLPHPKLRFLFWLVCVLVYVCVCLLGRIYGIYSLL